MTESTTGRAECSTCGKHKIVYLCEGCSQKFCLKDLTEHRQLLDNQLDQVITDCDQFRQNLIEQKQNENQRSWIQRIDEWTEISINKIKQTADECRKIFIKYTNDNVIEAEKKFNAVVTVLRKNRQESEIDEIHLNQAKFLLKELQKELDQCSNISVQEDSVPLIKKISVFHDSSMIIKCEYCHNRCERSDYKTHKNYCFENPSNINQRQTTVIPIRSNQNQASSHDIVHIPCEICQQLIDLPNWSNHIQGCHERELQRSERYPEAMNQQSVIERFPCEYCQRLYLAQQLYVHKINCMNNPVDIYLRRGCVQRPKPSNNGFLPISPQNNQNSPSSPKPRSSNDSRFTQCQSIDIDRANQVNRPPDNEIENSVRSGRSYENLSIGSNKDPLQLPRKFYSSGISRRVRSFDNLGSIYDSKYLSNNYEDYLIRPNNNHQHQNNISHTNEVS
ncbi:unnamed protein product [Rotaria socialis]